MRKAKNPLRSRSACAMNSSYEAHDLGGLLERPEGRAGDHGADRVQPEPERSDDAEVAAAAAESPQQVGVLLLACLDHAAVGQDHVRLEQVVDREAAPAGQVAQPAAKGQAADSGGGDDPAGGGHPERVRCVVDVAPYTAALHVDDAVLGIDPDTLHLREVDDQAVVHASETRAVMPPASDRELHPAVTGVVDRGDHICDVRAAGDQRRPLVDHRVVERTRLVVAGVSGGDELAAEALLERCWGLLDGGHGFTSCGGGMSCEPDVALPNGAGFLSNITPAGPPGKERGRPPLCPHRRR